MFKKYTHAIVLDAVEFSTGEFLILFCGDYVLHALNLAAVQITYFYIVEPLKLQILSTYIFSNFNPIEELRVWRQKSETHVNLPFHLTFCLKGMSTYTENNHSFFKE
jgi:type III secretory pathway component EscT